MMCENTVKLDYVHIFDPPSLTACGAEIEYELSKGNDFTIDFGSVQFIGSPFIGLLVKVGNDARRRGIKITAVNVKPGVETILHLTAVDSVIKVIK